MAQPTDRPFSHPSFGHQARVELDGNEVHLTFVANTPEQAESLVEKILKELMSGSLELTLMKQRRARQP